MTSNTNFLTTAEFPGHAILFGKTNCMPCSKAKKYLDAKGIAYIFVNTDDDKNMELFLSMGFMSVPVLKKGDTVIVGFDVDKYDKLFN